MAIVFEKSGKKYRVEECYQGLNLLAHSQLIELETGSQCGGHGRCGKDLIQIDDQSMLNHPTAIESLHLSVLQLKQGWRLACQCFPGRDGLEIAAKIAHGQ